MNDDLDAKIRQRAYAIWERENRPKDKHLEHWHCAQEEIEAEQSSAADQPESATSVGAASTEGADGAAPDGVDHAETRPS